MLNGTMHRNKIWCLKDTVGSWSYNPAEIKSSIFTHFSKIYASLRTTLPHSHESRVQQPPSLSSSGSLFPQTTKATEPLITLRFVGVICLQRRRYSSTTRPPSSSTHPPILRKILYIFIYTSKQTERES
nr:hypothetical protein CFP56_65096 [Quercus suber]